jgi:hypothetical protein
MSFIGYCAIRGREGRDNETRYGFGTGASPQDRERDQKPSWKALAPQGDETEIQRVIGHIRLLDEAGLIRGVKRNQGGSDIPENIELTWKGHEFLNDVRDPVIWGKTKERAKAVPSVGLGFLWEIAKAEIKTKLGLP